MDLLSIISDNIIRALSNTFLYSLWQGLILAAVAGLVIMLTRRSTPGKRYNLLVGLLISFTVVIITTFVIQYQRVVIARQQVATVCPEFPPAGEAINLTGSAGQDPGKFSFLEYINTHAEMIVLVWFLIVCARCVQLFTGLHGLQRLRRESVKPSEEWEEMLRRLTQTLGITQQVRLAESAIAKVPMVIGHFKPVILIPAALLAAMQPAEIEAVLVHELAHIRRRDYLVNMLQHLMEIVFFFNPAVLWVSSLIKTERENCCDDITLGKTNDKTAYIRALICCQEFQSQTPSMAVGLAGRKNLLGRVNRMVSHSNHSLSIIEKSMLTLCLVTAGIMLAAFAEREEQKAPPHVKVAKAPSADTLPVRKNVTAEDLNTFRIYQPAEVGEGTSVYIGNVAEKVGFKTYILKKEAQLYQLNYIRDTLVSLQVNGKAVTPAEWPMYADSVHELARQQERKLDDTFVHQTEYATEDDNDIFSRAEKTLSNGLNRTKNAIDAAGMELGRSLRIMQATEDSLRAMERLIEPNSSPGAYRITSDEQISRQDEERARKRQSQPGSGDAGQYSKTSDTYTEYKSTHTERNSYKTPYQPEKAPVSRRENWITVDELISHLVREGLVNEADEVKSFMLTPQQMIMNGKPVPTAVHQMILDKYVKADRKKKWTMYYNFDTSTIKSISPDGINAS
ncbi:M56 family metallopeptidase [Terrimonas sp. NA20]|uniref:M56 family metallopeptidase n=1 Tax=Terrimonas ginsenosidimutans TaxID=2908004 RepID=A0ABS9KQY3_9BACT|nr:M56 family metallopeptidase [Terrimonas ginsenosidimutans]MCG2614742.1 M56 family metallopeptidase [Terrimonas ginsenosidimutans]